MLSTMEYALIKHYMFSKYVDDVNLVLECLGLGVRWNASKRDMTWSQTWEDEDLEENLSDERRTAREILIMADDMSEEVALRFTGEIQEDQEENKVPMLDVKVWLEEHNGKQILLHSYYEKKATSRFVMMNSSAMPQQQKITTLVQETIRRMRNTSRRVVTSERTKILQKFLWKLE